MREIKFRAWDKVYKVMTACVTLDHLSSGFTGLFGDDKTVMQYTGLKDRKGVEMYEGDLLACVGYRPRPVEFGSYLRPNYITDGYGWHVKHPEFQDANFPHDEGHLLKPNKGTDICDMYAVVGNIYDNPELISDEK